MIGSGDIVWNKTRHKCEATKRLGRGLMIITEFTEL
jgi:hypothetical protein